MKIFKDRQSAGKILAKKLKHYFNDHGTIVLGIPRGGVVVAAEIAKKLNLPLDIIVIRKIGAPFQPELALGAVDPDGEVVWEERLLQEVGTQKEQLADAIQNEWQELKRREGLYKQGLDNLNVVDKKVILVDDGIATGATTLAATKFLKRNQAKVVLAVPVASKESADKLEKAVDELVVLEIPAYFQAVGQFYQHFEPVEDEEVIQLLKDER